MKKQVWERSVRVTSQCETDKCELEMKCWGDLKGFWADLTFDLFNKQRTNSHSAAWWKLISFIWCGCFICCRRHTRPRSSHTHTHTQLSSLRRSLFSVVWLTGLLKPAAQQLQWSLSWSDITPAGVHEWLMVVGGIKLSPAGAKPLIWFNDPKSCRVLERSLWSERLDGSTNRTINTHRVLLCAGVLRYIYSGWLAVYLLIGFTPGARLPGQSSTAVCSMIFLIWSTGLIWTGLRPVLGPTAQSKHM